MVLRRIILIFFGLILGSAVKSQIFRLSPKEDKCKVPNYTPGLMGHLPEECQPPIMKSIVETLFTTGNLTNQNRIAYRKAYDQWTECIASKSGHMDENFTKVNRTTFNKFIDDIIAPEKYKEIMKDNVDRCEEIFAKHNVSHPSNRYIHVVSCVFYTNYEQRQVMCSEDSSGAPFEKSEFELKTQRKEPRLLDENARD